MAVLPALLVATALATPACHGDVLIFHQDGITPHRMLVIPEEMAAYVGTVAICTKDELAWKCRINVEFGADIFQADLQCDPCTANYPAGKCTLVAAVKRVSYIDEVILRVIKFTVGCVFALMMASGCVLGSIGLWQAFRTCA